MARELRRLLIAAQRLPAEGRSLELLQAERHYLERVLRLRCGERFAISDGAGHLWTALLSSSGADLEQPIGRPLRCEPPPKPQLRLAVAMPRQDGDVMARMVCEQGIDALMPLRADRSSAGQGPRGERLEAVLREAEEQSERLWAMQLHPPQNARAWLGAPPPGLGLLATTRLEGLPLLNRQLASIDAPAGAAGLTLAIGPEGGWSSEEQAIAIRVGWQPVSLGPTILRVSTAAVTGAAALVSWRLGLTCPSCSRPSP
ncbi:MAG: RsmE family RNA methyltransferase [Cyanobacteriota bacterium]|nr:RsmE family RNA methyltransferase [Cyanobacteriota bacterium]